MPCGDPSQPRATLTAMPTLRVATYNLYLGADLTLVFGVADEADLVERARQVHDEAVGTDFAARAAAVAAILVREGVDVVGLQEVARWQVAEPGRAPEVRCDFLAELTGALEREGAPYDVHAVNPNFGGSAPLPDGRLLGVDGRNVVLVRRGSGVRVLEERCGTFDAVLHVPTGLAGTSFRVPRSCGWVDAELDGARFRFVNTHTEAWDAGVRDAQRDQLLSAVGEPGVPVVLVGDLNAGPAEVGMPAGYVDAWAVAGGPGPGWTCGQAADLANPESALDSRIDYVWVRDAAVTACRVVGDQPSDRTSVAKLWPSDHAGVVAEVLL